MNVRISFIIVCSIVVAVLTPPNVGAHPFVFVRPVGIGSDLSATPAWHRRDPRLTEFDAPGAATPNSPKLCGVGSCGTLAYSINDRGVIVGSYTDKYRVAHAFLRAPNGRFLSFDAPGAALAHGLDLSTVAWAINDRNAIAGTFLDAKLVSHGFIRSALGVFTTFDVPAASKVFEGTLALDINGVGTTAGGYSDNAGIRHGFARFSDGRIALFDPTGSTGTMVCRATCLNRAGAITGSFYNGNVPIRGFVREPSGKITAFDAPGLVRGQDSAGTYPASITADGTIAGVYYYGPSNTPLLGRGFVRFPNGKFVTGNAPNSNTTGTYPFSINCFDAIAGETGDGHGFERFPNGTTAEFVAPDVGNLGMRPSVNNAFGAVAGWYFDPAGLAHGFVWTP